MINHPGLNAENIPDLHLIISGAAPIGGSDVDRLLDKYVGSMGRHCTHTFIILFLIDGISSGFRR